MLLNRDPLLSGLLPRSSGRALVGRYHTYLRSGKPHSVCLLHCFNHIIYEALNRTINTGDPFSMLFKNGVIREMTHL